MDHQAGTFDSNRTYSAQNGGVYAEQRMAEQLEEHGLVFLPFRQPTRPTQAMSMGPFRG